MILVSEDLSRRLREVADLMQPEDLVLRLEEVMRFSNGKAMADMQIGQPREDDQIVKYRGEPVMHISNSVSRAYEGCVLDIEERDGRSGFVVRPPLA